MSRFDRRFGISVAVIGLWLLAILAVAGCSRGGRAADGSPINLDKFERIRPDMQIKDVVDILGEPADKVWHGSSKDCTWIWKDGDRKIEVVFQTGGYVLARGSRVVKYGYNLE